MTEGTVHRITVLDRKKDRMMRRDREIVRESDRKSERQREWEKRYKEPLKRQEEESRACRYKPGQSCLANWGQFAAGEKCRIPQVVYNTENIWNELSYTNTNTKKQKHRRYWGLVFSYTVTHTHTHTHHFLSIKRHTFPIALYNVR